MTRRSTSTARLRETEAAATTICHDGDEPLTMTNLFGTASLARVRQLWPADDAREHAHARPRARCRADIGSRSVTRASIQLTVTAARRRHVAGYPCAVRGCPGVDRDAHARDPVAAISTTPTSARRLPPGRRHGLIPDGNTGAVDPLWKCAGAADPKHAHRLVSSSSPPAPTTRACCSTPIPARPVSRASRCCPRRTPQATGIGLPPNGPTKKDGTSTR